MKQKTNSWRNWAFLAAFGILTFLVWCPIVYAPYGPTTRFGGIPIWAVLAFVWAAMLFVLEWYYLFRSNLAMTTGTCSRPSPNWKPWTSTAPTCRKETEHAGIDHHHRHLPGLRPDQLSGLPPRLHPQRRRLLRRRVQSGLFRPDFQPVGLVCQRVCHVRHGGTRLPHRIRRVVRHHRQPRSARLPLVLHPPQDTAAGPSAEMDVDGRPVRRPLRQRACGS
jgi:hypothetical protein